MLPLVLLVAATSPPPAADFERHVVPVLGRAGCSAGGCHGAFAGKGGLRLSLFGFDPAADFAQLTRGGGGRRVGPADPDASLLLLKATGRVPHGGGRRFAVGSWEYRVLRDWVAAGTRHTPGSGAVVALQVLPAEVVLAPGGSGRMTVRATFADGSNVDVTQFADLRAKDDSVADVSAAGMVTAVRPGDTAVVAGYGGRVVSGRCAE